MPERLNLLLQPGRTTIGILDPPLVHVGAAEDVERAQSLVEAYIGDGLASRELRLGRESDLLGCVDRGSDHDHPLPGQVDAEYRADTLARRDEKRCRVVLVRERVAEDGHGAGSYWWACQASWWLTNTRAEP